MQDRYVGDIGDFCKFGLLRHLIGFQKEPKPDLSLGMIWYRTIPSGAEGQNNDGGNTGYLCDEKRRLRILDPSLWDRLGSIVVEGKPPRCVRNIKELRIFPEQTIFYPEILAWSKPSTRSIWFEGAIDAVKGCDIVFLDPDNGIIVDSVRSHHQRGGKYATVCEICQISERGLSVIIYQHAGGRRRTFPEQIRSKLCQLRDNGVSAHPFALQFKHSRSMLVAPAPNHHALILARANEFAKKWGPDLCRGLITLR
jgi:hypothetical protein